jgi:hypothetical protein
MKKSLTICPGACLDGMAGQCPRGRLDATRGRLHHGTTGSTTIGASTGVHMHTQGSPRRSPAGVREEADEVTRSVANLMKNPEQDPAMNLTGEEAANETVRWRWKRALGRVIRPRWRRRWSPGLAGVARRRRRRRRRSSHQRERGEEEVRE